MSTGQESLKKQFSKAADVLKSGGVVVLPTDTLYGIVASAAQPDAVERIFSLKQRSREKPLIVLINSFEQLEQFRPVLTGVQRRFLNMTWPEPASVIMPVADPGGSLAHIHRGKQEIAFRLPNDPALAGLLTEAGPVVAPSANTEGEEPARSVEEARAYFGDGVDLYVDGGERESAPSTLLRFSDGGVEVLRDGVVSRDTIASNWDICYNQ